VMAVLCCCLLPGTPPARGSLPMPITTSCLTLYWRWLPKHVGLVLSALCARDLFACVPAQGLGRTS
jgi:hypothetical protein